MSEDFDRFIAAALAPPERQPDPQFVSRVHARLMLEDRLREERRSMLGRLAEQLTALAAVAIGLWCMGRAPLIANWFALSPALGLALLLTAFAALVAVLSFQGDSGRWARLT